MENKKSKLLGKRKVERKEGEVFSAEIERIKDACRNGELSVGETMRLLRELIGFSQKEYAAKIGLSRATLSSIENDSRSASLSSVDQALRPFAFELRIMPKG